MSAHPSVANKMNLCSPELSDNVQQQGGSDVETGYNLK
jgi:hypothetical protein